MAKIIEITVHKTIQEKQYEPLELSMTASINEGEDVNKVVDDLRFFVGYKVNEESRNDTFTQFQDEVASGLNIRGKELSEKEISQRKAWIEKYHEARERAENLDILG